MKAFRLTLILSLLVGCCWGFCAGARDTVTLFVSPDGCDMWSGRAGAGNADGSDGPLATLAAARDRARDLKALGMPIRVLVRGGSYYVGKPTVLKPEDSGTESEPITYQAYPGETPVIYGAVSVDDWYVRRDGTFMSTIPACYRDEWGALKGWINGERRVLKRYPKDDRYFGLLQGPQFDGLEPGRWYVDPRSAKVYYNPLEGETTDNLQLLLSTALEVIQFRGDVEAKKYVEYVNVRGLTFKYSMLPAAADTDEMESLPAVIHGIGARNCSVKRCSFTHLGMTGVWFEPSPETNKLCCNRTIDLLTSLE